MGKLQRTSQSQRFPLSHNPVHFCVRPEPETKTWKNCYIASYFLYLPSLSPQLTSRSTAREDPRTTQPKTYVSSAHAATTLAPLNSNKLYHCPRGARIPPLSVRFSSMPTEMRVNQTYPGTGQNPTYFIPFSFILRVTGLVSSTTGAAWRHQLARNIHPGWSNHKNNPTGEPLTSITLTFPSQTRARPQLADGRVLQLALCCLFHKRQYTQPFQPPAPPAHPNGRAAAASLVARRCLGCLKPLSPPSKRARPWHPC